jgi:hypothetical protein
VGWAVGQGVDCGRRGTDEVPLVNHRFPLVTSQLARALTANLNSLAGLRGFIPSLLSLVDSFDASARQLRWPPRSSPNPSGLRSTQELPTIPTVQEMEIWDEKQVPR